MRTTRNNKTEQLEKIEGLLYGYNYQVWFGLFGPTDTESSLQAALCELISDAAVVSNVIPSTAMDARNDIIQMVLYEGLTGSGPIELEKKRAVIISLVDDLLAQIDLTHADIVSAFSLKSGHPAYPVFWDFAYDVHSKGQRWIFIGSSSD